MIILPRWSHWETWILELFSRSGTSIGHIVRSALPKDRYLAPVSQEDHGRCSTIELCKSTSKDNSFEFSHLPSLFQKFIEGTQKPCSVPRRLMRLSVKDFQRNSSRTYKVTSVLINVNSRPSSIRRLSSRCFQRLGDHVRHRYTTEGPMFPWPAGGAAPLCVTAHPCWCRHGQKFLLPILYVIKR